MFETTTQRTRARADRLVCASRKGGGGKARGEEGYPNIIEEPIRVIGGEGGKARKSGGKKSGKGGAAGKGARGAAKGSAKKRGG